jgi:hypothetical protein
MFSGIRGLVGAYAASCESHWFYEDPGLLELLLGKGATMLAELARLKMKEAS